MKKSIVLATAVIILAACQKNKETAPETPAASAEIATDATSTVTDSVVLPETENEVEVMDVKTDSEKKTIEITTVKPANGVAVEYASFGDKIMADKALTKEDMIKKYNSLKPGDTVNVKFKSKINAVCQKKGCWMSLALPGGKETFVKFKDYAFFVPLNAADQEAIVSGKAFISETSVAQLRHYAKDGGKSEAEIAKITKPEVEYKFMADGVLISK